MNKKTITILIIILVVAIASGFWFVKNQNNVILNSFQNLNKDTQETQKPENQNNVTPEKSGIQNEQNGETISQDNQENKAEELKVEDIDTSDWKEYCNEEYGFCLKYPKDWDVQVLNVIQNNNIVLSLKFSNNKYDFIKNCEYIFLDVNRVDDITIFEDLLSQSDDTFKHKFSRIKYIHNNNVEIIVGDLMPDFLNAVIIADKYWYRIEIGSDIGGANINNQCKNIYYGILSTFRLLK